MKAFLLAAGVGSRLRPVTDTTPKCLLEFDGASLLHLWLAACSRAGVDEVLVNLHHLAGAVCRALDQWTGRPAVSTFFEPELLGSAGTLLANRHWVRDEEMFLVCNTDTLTDFDLAHLVRSHRTSGRVASLAVFHADRPSTCGIVEIDAQRQVVSFHEKPAHPVSDLANAGMYAFHPSVLDELQGSPPLDIGHDLLPKLVGRMGAIDVDGYLLDIGTPAAYRQAQREWHMRAVS